MLGRQEKEKNILEHQVQYLNNQMGNQTQEHNEAIAMLNDMLIQNS